MKLSTIVMFMSFATMIFSEDKKELHDLEIQFKQLELEWVTIDKEYDIVEAKIIFKYVRLLELRRKIKQEIATKDSDDINGDLVTRGKQGKPDSYFPAVKGACSVVSDKELKNRCTKQSALLCAKEYDLIDAPRERRRKILEEIEQRIAICDSQLTVFYYVKKQKERSSFFY